jgi:hypothetical protein
VETDNHEVEISLGTKDDLPDHIFASESFFHVNRNEAILRVENIGTFVVKNGSNIRIIPIAQSDADQIRRYIIGNLLGILLYQRGFTVLHASCIRINRKTVALLGDIGIGKSTLAASLIAHGHEFIADDISAIDLSNQPYQIIPTYPYLKIHPDMAHKMGLSTSKLIPVCVGEEKKWLPVHEKFVQTPQPLFRVYVLYNHDNGDVSIKPLNSQESVLEYIRYSVPTRWKFPSDGRHFEDILRLANNIQLYKLQRPNNFASLPDVVRKIEEHLTSS